MPDLGTLFEKFAANLLSSALSQVIADEFGVKISTLRRLGMGYNPLKNTFVFPERDNKGKIIGLSQRRRNGKRWMHEGSKRGLTYPVNTAFLDGDTYVPGKHNWKRVHEAGISCPICGKPDWCMVSADNTSDPEAVLCGRISKGSIRHLPGCGFLHILKPERVQIRNSSQILPRFEGPILITEGYSDTATAIDMGFMAIGKPSAQAGNEVLIPLIKDHNVIIVGDNDIDEVGKRGMDATFHVLKPTCRSIIKVLPPKEYKDLRQWKTQIQLDKQSFLDWTEQHGDSTIDADILGDGAPMTVAKAWLDRNSSPTGVPLVRSYGGQWVKFNGSAYYELDMGSLRGSIYRFLETKSFPKMTANGKAVISDFKPTRAKVSDVLDALNTWCPITSAPPCWLDKPDMPGPENLIVFRNGILDVNEYVAGRIKLYNPDPSFFTFGTLPYDFDENAKSELWDGFLDDVLSGDADKKRLLAQWFGYNCVPDMTMEKLMFCTGRPRSGKGTMINALGAMLGSDQYAATSLRILARPFGLQNLMGKLAVFMSDVRVTDFATSQATLETILHIVGGDPVGLERKHISNLAKFYLTCRFTIATNGLLEIRDDQDALRNKINILHFEKSYAGHEDVTLKPRIQREAAEGKLINFALAGLRDLRQQGSFVIPSTSRIISDTIRDINTPVFGFVKECCHLAPPESEKTHTVSKDMMYDVWVAWCKENNCRYSNKAWFGRNLMTHFPGLKSIRLRASVQRLNHMHDVTETVHAYDGIKLNRYAYRKFLGIDSGDE